MAKQDPIRRSRRLLSPEQKWEIFLEINTGDLTQADAARVNGAQAQPAQPSLDVGRQCRRGGCHDDCPSMA
jgi:hypothetical protein